MYNFQEHLLENEIILYEGESVPGKGYKNLIESLFIIGFSLVMMLIPIFWELAENKKTGDSFDFGGIIGVLLLFGFFLALGVYNLIENFFLRKKYTTGVFNCVTNLRVLKYESKKNRLTYGYLKNYVKVKCDNVKDNYGDVYMHIDIEKKLKENTDPLKQVISYFKLVFKQDPENIAIMNFNSIENPDEVKKIILEAKNKKI